MLKLTVNSEPVYFGNEKKNIKKLVESLENPVNSAQRVNFQGIF
jgi:hypothetical protein